MTDPGACVATLKDALQCAEELHDKKAVHALSMRIEAVAGRLAAALMAAARAGTHEQFGRVRAEAELLKPQLQKSLKVCTAPFHEYYRVLDFSVHCSQPYLFEVSLQFCKWFSIPI